MAEIRISSGPHFCRRQAGAGFNLFTDTVTFPRVFGQGKASGRTDNFERAANFGGPFRIRHKPRTVDLAQSSGFPIKMEGSMVFCRISRPAALYQ
jgi:hypothetical protein